MNQPVTSQSQNPQTSYDSIKAALSEKADELKASPHGSPGSERSFVAKILEDTKDAQLSIAELESLRDLSLSIAKQIGGVLCEKGGMTFARLAVTLESERSRKETELTVMADTPFPQGFTFPSRSS